MIEKALELIKEDEGFRAKPYLDSLGILTIGYGTQIADGISREEAELLLKYRAGKALEAIRLEPYWLRPDLGETRQAVLLSLVYNLGWPRYSKFQQMRLALGVGNYAKAAEELKDSRWYTQVGNRGPKLVAMLNDGE